MKDFIRKLILTQKNKSISMEKFIEVALYDKNLGYYTTKNPIGTEGDFITSPEISQLFGEIIAIWLLYALQKFTEAKKFTLIELGPGSGALMADILRVLKKFRDYYNRIEVHLVEISDVLKEKQCEKLKSENVTWNKSIYTIPDNGSPVFFIANEFFDALPIQQYHLINGVWHENHITVDDKDQFKIVPVVTNDEKLKLYNNIPNYGIVEVRKGETEIMKFIENRIIKNGGEALIIDYGYIYPNYKNTIQSVKKHRYQFFLENAGHSDITSHVNFTELNNNLTSLQSAIMTQKEFLYKFGIKERLHSLLKANSNESLRENLQSSFLRITEDMGSLFKVLNTYNYNLGIFSKI